MADEVHLTRFQQGVEQWNEWRKTNHERPDLKNANLTKCNFVRANLSKAQLQNSNLTGVDLTDTNLKGANLCDTELGHTILTRTDLREAILHKSYIGGAILRGTKLWRIEYFSNHNRLHDGSETIKLPRRDKLLNWSRLRAIGAFPLFGVSWSALAISLIVINGIGLLNDQRPFIDILKYPVLIPERTVLLLVSSILLAIGSTLFKVACPSRVQEFSETQWVEQQRYARLQYIAESLTWGSWRHAAQWPTAFFTFIDGLTALWLMVDSVWLAIKYLIEYL